MLTTRSRRALVRWVGLAALLAAAGGWWWSRPPTEARCAAIGDAGRREACLREVWLRDAHEPEAIEAAIAASGEATTRDLLRLRLVTLEPARAGVVCPAVEGGQARQLCLLIEGRTHLWEAPPKVEQRGQEGGEKRGKEGGETRGRGRRGSPP